LARIYIIYIVGFFTNISSDFLPNLRGQSAERNMTNDIKRWLPLE
jgi:hypothetical protein